MKTLVTWGSVAVLVRAGTVANLRIVRANLSRARFGRAIRHVTGPPEDLVILPAWLAAGPGHHVDGLSVI